MLRSIVEYYAEHEGYSCGYCKRPDTNYSHGMWAHALTASDYQDLIDRGWRRSGKYCYKPTLDVTCCPMYTIRCRALEFKASKSQKKVLKRFNKFLSGEDASAADTTRKMSCSSGGGEGEMADEGNGEQFVETTRQPQDINVNSLIRTDTDSEQIVPKTSDSSSKDGAPLLDVESTGSVKDFTTVKEIKKGTGPDLTKSPCKKAKQLRWERKLEKLKEKGVDVGTLSTTEKNKEKQIEDFINELPKEYQKRLEVKLVRTAPPSPEWLATAKETHEVYVKYQTTVHNDRPEKCTEPKFRDFLVQSPLLEEYTETGPPCGYGSFHQQYWLDGKLIAVGVIDVLPKCVSSVYFFYDPQYMFLTPGTYGALREIAFTRHLHTLCSSLQYYYMGFYIHSCRKMRYKGNFYPSDLVCPETYQWSPLKECILKLEASPYSRLNEDIDATDTNYPTENDLSYVPVWVKGVVMPYKMYKRKFSKKKDDTEEVMQYARLVGSKCAKSLILVR